MRKSSLTALDFEVDKLTNSIENVSTGEVLSTNILPVTKEDLKRITKKNGWAFDWKYEWKQPEREVCKLVISDSPSVIHGLICFQNEVDHVFMHLIESAPFNKGKEKQYIGVPGNLVAYVCKQSKLRGFDGNVSFFSKSQLINHYIETLGASYVGGCRMIIDTKAALKLITRYFKDSR